MCVCVMIMIFPPKAYISEDLQVIWFLKESLTFKSWNPLLQGDCVYVRAHIWVIWAEDILHHFGEPVLVLSVGPLG